MRVLIGFTTANCPRKRIASAILRGNPPTPLPVNIVASSLFAASAVIAMLLGLAHLLFTYRGQKVLPRDPLLQARMQEVSPGITRQTTMWRFRVGFNASHRAGLSLFGAIYAYLALARGALLFGSVFLLALGLVGLLGYLFMARLYFFSTPFLGALLATALYVVVPAIEPGLAAIKG